MKYKMFNYKDYKNCWFEVRNYYYPQQSMYIKIVNKEEGDITDVTINMADYFYLPNTATIKNYSENSGMTDFLIALDIIDCVYSKKKCNIYAQDDKTIDFCAINIDELKKYSKIFEYEFSY